MIPEFFELFDSTIQPQEGISLAKGTQGFYFPCVNELLDFFELLEERY